MSMLIRAALVGSLTFAAGASAQILPPAPAAPAPAAPYEPKAPVFVPSANHTQPPLPGGATAVQPNGAQPPAPGAPGAATPPASSPGPIDIIQRDASGALVLAPAKSLDDLAIDIIAKTAQNPAKIAAARAERQALQDRIIVKNAGSAVALYPFMQQIEGVKDTNQMIAMQANILGLRLPVEPLDMLNTSGALSAQEYQVARSAVDAYRKQINAESMKVVSSGKPEGYTVNMRNVVKQATVETLPEVERVLVAVADNWAAIKANKDVGSPTNAAAVAAAEEQVAKAKTPQEKAMAILPAIQAYPQEAWSAMFAQVAKPLPAERLIPDSALVRPGVAQPQRQPIRATPVPPPTAPTNPAAPAVPPSRGP